MGYRFGEGFKPRHAGSLVMLLLKRLSWGVGFKSRPSTLEYGSCVERIRCVAGFYASGL